MDGKTDLISPSTEEELWASPVDLCSSQAKNEMRLIMSTPNLVQWKPLSMSLEDSGSSSRHDSGYCSLTPSTIASFSEESLEKCNWCRKHQREDYELSPPLSICKCKKRFMPKTLSSNLEYLQTISETKATPSGLFSSTIRPSTTCDLFEEAMMDASLYHDETESDSPQNESQGYVVDPMEIGEETSIDFLDSNPFLTQNSTPINLCKGISPKSDDTSIHREYKTEGFSSQTPVLGCHSTTGNMGILSKEKKDNFIFVAKKVATINRVVKSFSLNGIEKTDILCQLAKRRINCPHIVSEIFSYLSEKDLDSVALVSKSWNELLSNDLPAYNRWKLYKQTMALMRENLSSPTKESASVQWRHRGGLLSPLQSIENNVVRPQQTGSGGRPRRSPPVSPQSARFRSFQKAAKTLRKGERLLPCPRCFFPSRDYGSPTLQCSRSGCRHRFCVWCRNEILSGVNHDCPPRYTPKSNSNSSYKIAAVGSKTCKRKLRRLTLD